MKQLGIIIFILSVLSISLFAQDTSWKKIRVDENLSVSFPGEVLPIDTTFLKDGKQMRIKVYKYETPFASFGLIVTPNETNLNVDNRESLQKALAEMAKGASDAMANQSISCSTIDTSIDNMRCKKLTCHSMNIPLLNNYIFLINDKMYSFQCVFFNQYGIDIDAKKSNYFLQSVFFNKTSIKELKFGSKAESIGYKIGYYIIPAIFIIGIIVYFVRRL